MMSASPNNQDDTLLDLLHIVWRRKLLIATLIVAITTTTMALVSNVKPAYTATASVLIEPHRPLTESEFGQTAGSVDETTVASQVEILRSRSLATRVIRDLDVDPETIEVAGLEATVESWAATVSTWVVGQAPAFDGTFTTRQDAIDSFLTNVRVVREGESNVVSVAVTLANPERAAAIANAIVDTYLEGQLTDKLQAAERASRWLENKLAAQRAELDATEARLARLSVTEPGAVSANEFVDRFELANLRQELVEAGLERHELETRLSRLKQRFATGNTEFASDALGGSVLLQNLQAQKAELLRREAELSSRYGERHPRIQAVQAEKAELSARIQDEQRALLEEFETKLGIAEDREAQIAAELETLKAASAAQSRTALRRAELERDVDLQRELYESYLAQFEALTDPETVQAPDARVISDAVPPEQPSSPNLKLAFALASTIATLLALMITYLFELVDRGFRTGREVENKLGLGTMMIVPALQRGRRNGLEPHETAIRHPRSRYAETLRHGLAALLAGNDPGETRVLLLTSTVPGEGKSSLAMSLGRLSSLEGKRVLLIDGDLRQPAIAARLGLDGANGLLDIAANTATIDEALQADPETSMRILTAGKGDSSSMGLGAAGKLAEIIAWARRRFDLVLIDSPPLSAVADAKLYAAHADILVYIIHWHRTKRALVERTLIDLRRLDPPPAAAVLNHVNLKEHARWARHETGFGYPELKAYYAD